jgi:hypothetical protein
MQLDIEWLMTAQEFITIISTKEDGRGKGWFRSSGELTIRKVCINEKVELDKNFKYPNNLKLESCEILGISITKGVFKGVLEIKKCNVGLFRIDNQVILKNSLNISYCELNSIFINGTHEYEVDIVNSTIKSVFEIKDGIFLNRFNIESNIFEGEVRFWGGNFKYDLLIFYSTFKSEVSFNNVYFEKQINIGEEVNFESDLTFQSGSFAGLLISGGTYKCISIRGGIFREFNIFDNPKIQQKIDFVFHQNLNIFSLNIDFSKLECKSYLFEGKEGKIDNLHLKGIISKDILCEFVSINTPDNIIIDNLTNFGNIYFKDVTPTSLIKDDHGFFVIKNSDLGKTTFMGSDFSTLYLDFHSSKITESFLSDTIMPYQIKTFIRKEGTITIKDNPEQQRLGYGQLKKIYENRGDAVTALSYYAKEMNALMISPNIGFGERINLFFGRISNNHGTDWILGVISTFICGGICFFFFCFHFNIKPSFTYQGWTFFWNNSMPAFLEFFNPLHKTKEIVAILKNVKPDAVKLNWDNSLVDFLSKISITYFEYQLIQAFRKYGKK